MRNHDDSEDSDYEEVNLIYLFPLIRQYSLSKSSLLY